MSVATQIGLPAHKLEWMLCIEGVGWPSDELDLSDGFDGDIWVTQDFDGTLAADIGSSLGCTIRHGLVVGGSISESIDPITAAYNPGNMTFKIVNTDDWWTTNFAPHKRDVTRSEIITASGLTYQWLDIALADGTEFDNGDVVWMAGKEALYLYGKSFVSGTIYSYDVLRGHLGTTRGRTNKMPSDASAFTWPQYTRVYKEHRFWANRYVELWAHVPGEAPEECVRVFSGRLANIKRSNVGHEVSISVRSDPVRDVGRIWRARDMACGGSVKRNTINHTVEERGYNAWNMRAEVGLLRELRIKPYRPTGPLDEKGEGKYALAAGYRYRTEPGGTAGMRATWDADGVQALGDAGDEDVNVIMRYMKIGNQVYLAKKQADEDGDPEVVLTEAFSSLGYNNGLRLGSDGQPRIEHFPRGTPCRFLLDNYSDAWQHNHYAVNQVVTRHPIDLALSHITSRDDEYYIGDAQAGSSATVVLFPTGTLKTDDIYIGAALHCVEGDNKGESRLIIDNSTSTVRVEEAFSNTPSAGDEYQIRNSIYDTLPIGWGLGVPYQRIDIPSFERIREKNIPSAEVSKFILGVEDEVNIWELLQKNVFEPYGIHVYRDKINGKLTASYIGYAVGDGVIYDYVTVQDKDVISIGDLDDRITRPISTINVTVRKSEEKVVNIIGSQHYTLNSEALLSGDAGLLGQTISNRVAYESVRGRVPAEMGGDTEDIEHKAPRFEVFNDTGTESLKIQALFNTRDTLAAVSNRAIAFLQAYAIPPPMTKIRLPISFLLSIRPGVFLVVSKDDGPLNPFLLTRGWNQVVCMVVGTRIDIGPSEAAVECDVLVLDDLNGGKIAPAGQIDGVKSGSDGTSDYFEIARDAFVSDVNNDNDLFYFAVGDRLQLYEEDGSLQAATVYTIRSFGLNDVSDPEDASPPDIIRVNESVPAAGVLTTDMYLTFAAWSASNTARMEKYAAYADASGALSGGDDAKEYI